MAGKYGYSQSNDIVPNGPIVSLPNLALPATLDISTYASNGTPSILNIIGSQSWNVNTIVSNSSQGVYHAAGNEVYIPVNGQTTLYFGGSGTLNLTLYTTRDNES